MTTFARRRRYGLSALAAVTLVTSVVYGVYVTSLRDVSFVSGWLLLGLIVVLMALNARKKLPFLPLWSAAAWLQVHVYVGLFSVVCFAMHVEFRMPGGVLEATLAALFATVVLSGVLGLWLVRAIPKRLSTVRDQVLFERQPALRRALRQELDQVIERASSHSLAEFYARRLISFFAKPQHMWHHLRYSSAPQHNLLTELDATARYLNDDEKAAKDEIARLIRAKAALDYQFAHHTVLKYWLFVHIPVSYSLLILGVVHATLAYVFRIGW